MFHVSPFAFTRQAQLCNIGMLQKINWIHEIVAHATEYRFYVSLLK